VAALRGTGKHCGRRGRALKHAGPLTEHELPIDSHMLIALAAPRPIFIGADTIDTVDGWINPKGSFLAAAAASPARSLPGQRGLSTPDFPPVLMAVIEGRVGFRQHHDGHNNRDNWPVLIDFASKHLFGQEH
jgi:hypothetical protein